MYKDAYLAFKTFLYYVLLVICLNCFYIIFCCFGSNLNFLKGNYRKFIQLMQLQMNWRVLFLLLSVIDRLF